jgi:hypothetical protein
MHLLVLSSHSIYILFIIILFFYYDE